MFATKKKKLTSLIAVLGLLALSTAAYAYWTSTGSGTGSGTTGTTTAVTVNQGTTLTAMYPGDTAQTLAGTFNNPNPGSVTISSVTATVSSVLKGGVAATGCDASDFTIGGTATVGGSGVVPTGSTQGSWTGLTIKFNNKTATNQDACKGVTVNLAYTAS